jgi:hypothetical protein
MSGSLEVETRIEAEIGTVIPEWYDHWLNMHRSGMYGDQPAILRADFYDVVVGSRYQAKSHVTNSITRLKNEGRWWTEAMSAYVPLDQSVEL